MKCFIDYTERCLEDPYKSLVENEVYGGNFLIRIIILKII